MNSFEHISTAELFWGKLRGCYREYGVKETIRRIIKEFFRLKRNDGLDPDISIVTENLAIGAAPRSLQAVDQLKKSGYTNIIDLRAERKPEDILAKNNGITVYWLPTYDDWRPKSKEFFGRLSEKISRLAPNPLNKTLICCHAGEHRAPLAGVVALLIMGHTLEDAVSKVKKARPIAELIPVYLSSLQAFLKQYESLKK